MAMRDGFTGGEVEFATTLPGLAERFGLSAHVIPDCNRNEKWNALRCAAVLLWLIVSRRPQVIVTTGALPGFFAVAIGRRFGARTMWIDSVANAEEMSMAGRLARAHVDRWITQWPGVAETTGAQYHGSVL